MKELLYFQFADLLVRAEHSTETNSLKYASHREISFDERILIEQYLLTKFAVKTEYYNRNPAFFIYTGKDPKLVKDLNLFHLKRKIKLLAGRDKEVKQQVTNLITKSMTNYYFEQIGNEILSFRKKVKENWDEKIIYETKSKMDELIKAYNLYSERKITLEDVIPFDLKEYIF